MFSVLFIEDEQVDLSNAVRSARASGLTPLDLHAILMVNEDVERYNAARIQRDIIGLSSLKLISKISLTYSQLLAEAVEIAARVGPDIAVVDLHLLSRPDDSLQLCDLTGLLKGKKNNFEGIQLTRDLDRTGLISWFVWYSSNFEPALDINEGYLCESQHGSVILSVPRVSLLDKTATDMLSTIIKGLAVASSEQLVEKRALYEIPQGHLIKVWTDFEFDISIKHWLERSLPKGGPEEAFKSLLHSLRRLSQATLIPYYVPACRVSSILRAYKKPWLDDVLNMALKKTTAIFQRGKDSPRISDDAFIDKLFIMADALRSWLFCVPLPEVIEIINHCLLQAKLDIPIAGHEAVKNTDDTLEFGARSVLIELFYNIFKNAREHGSSEKGVEAACNVSLNDDYLVMEVVNKCVESKRPKEEAFTNPSRGLRIMERCTDELNNGAYCTFEEELWCLELACSINGKIWYKRFPKNFDSSFTELTAGNGQWCVRMHLPRKRM